MAVELSRRRARTADLEFLFRLFKLALGPSVEQTYGAWDERAQRERFMAHTVAGSHEILALEGEPIGCLFVRRSRDAFHLKRIFLLPEHQKRGLGTRLVNEILEEARDRGLPVRLRVFRVNPARALYARLGFVVTGETETHVHMEYNA